MWNQWQAVRALVKYVSRNPDYFIRRDMRRTGIDQNGFIAWYISDYRKWRPRTTTRTLSLSENVEHAIEECIKDGYIEILEDSWESPASRNIRASVEGRRFSRPENLLHALLGKWNSLTITSCLCLAVR